MPFASSWRCLDGNVAFSKLRSSFSQLLNNVQKHAGKGILDLTWRILGLQRTFERRACAAVCNVLAWQGQDRRWVWMLIFGVGRRAPTNFGCWCVYESAGEGLAAVADGVAEPGPQFVGMPVAPTQAGCTDGGAQPTGVEDTAMPGLLPAHALHSGRLAAQTLAQSQGH